jgi:hypothetical protein
MTLFRQNRCRTPTSTQPQARLVPKRFSDILRMTITSKRTAVKTARVAFPPRNELTRLPSFPPVLCNPGAILLSEKQYDSTMELRCLCNSARKCR